MEDFRTYGERCYPAGRYSPEQYEAIQSLGQFIEEFCETNMVERFDPAALESNEWESIRTQAKIVLTAFGYRLSVLPESVETTNGVWNMDLSDYELEKLISE